MQAISIIGGTGALGQGLAYRWLRAGHQIVIGSRDATRAAASADDLNRRLGSNRASGLGNRLAAGAGDVVVLTVPFSSHDLILTDIKNQTAGKLVIDAAVPLRPPVHIVSLPDGGSAAVIAQDKLGPTSNVVAAFHNVAAAKLGSDVPIDCDVLVCGDDPVARQSVITLVGDAGLRGIHAGPLANAAACEAMTSVLISINKSYSISDSGLRITGNIPPRVSDAVVQTTTHRLA